MKNKKQSQNGCSYVDVPDKELLAALDDASKRHTLQLNEEILNGNLVLPKVHGNTKIRTEFTKGTGFYGKTLSEIREMARESSRELVKALNTPDGFRQLEDAAREHKIKK